MNERDKPQPVDHIIIYETISNKKEANVCKQMSQITKEKLLNLSRLEMCR